MKIDVLPSFFFFVKKAKETERGGEEGDTLHYRRINLTFLLKHSPSRNL